MSNFETLTPLQGGLPGTAPKFFIGSTADNLAAVTATGYLNDIGSGLSLEQNDSMWLRISDGDIANVAVLAGLVSITGTAPNLVYSWIQGIPGEGTDPGNVVSVFGRSGHVVAQTGDYAVAQVTGAAPLASPTFTGVPAAPTADPGTNTTQLATTAFVAAAVAAEGVTSFAGRTGVVVPTTGDYAVANVTGAAPLASPTFTGVPAVPTAAPGTNTTQAASTAFVTAAVSAPTLTLPSGEIFVGNGSNVATGVAMSGDATITNTGAVALSATTATAGTFGSATQVAQISVDGKGRVQGNSNVSIQITESQVTGLSAALSALAPLAAPSFTGGVVVAGGAAISSGDLTVTAGSITSSGRIGNTSGGLGIIGNSQITGDLTLNTAGSKLNIATGTNGTVGTGTLASGTVTINNTSVTAQSAIFMSIDTAGGSGGAGILSIGGRTPGTSFVVNSSNIADSSTFVYWIIN